MVPTDSLNCVDSLYFTINYLKYSLAHEDLFLHLASYLSLEQYFKVLASFVWLNLHQQSSISIAVVFMVTLTYFTLSFVTSNKMQLNALLYRYRIVVRLLQEYHLHVRLSTNYNSLTCCRSYYHLQIHCHTRLTLNRIRCHPGRLSTTYSCL